MIETGQVVILMLLVVVWSISYFKWNKGESTHVKKNNNNKKSTVLYCFIETMYDIVAKILSRELSNLRYIKNI